jgi:cytochrome b subunit of formate dehydrogenase
MKLATRLVLLAGAIPLWAAMSSGAVIENSDCFECHADKSFVKSNATGQAVSLFVDQGSYGASVHGSNRCVMCHADITDLPHEEKLKPVGCRTCHAGPTDRYLKSDHGAALARGVTEAPACADCHGSPHTIAAVGGSNSPVSRVNIPETCARCHRKTEKMEKFNFSQQGPTISYEKSVHGIAFLRKRMDRAAVCTDCHGSHDLLKATNPESKLHWQKITSTCGACHTNILGQYSRSVHGKAMLAGKRHTPVCTDCHGEHALAAVASDASPVNATHVSETCSQCHASKAIVTKYRLPQQAVNSYMESYHGLSMQLGGVKAANCASCHSAHEILPSSDPASSINPGHLVKTCGRCHPRLGKDLKGAKIHTGVTGTTEHVAITYVRWAYIFLIAGVLGGMFVHNLLDYAKKIRTHMQRQRAQPGKERMSLGERVQHGVLIVTFVALVYTGFALKFPHAWWARLFTSAVDWRGMLHHVAALLFCLLSVYHTAYVMFTARGRHHLRALLPALTDVEECWGTFLYYVGLRPDKPTYGFYSYIEKAEYWALVWGSVIMAATGALMTWSDWTLTLFPKWVYDLATTVHYYEAILATFAIILWHFYFVTFDPDEYPMKLTFLTGRESEQDRRRRPH